MINLATFDLNLLRVFEALARHRSVSIAADRLGLSQPAVSNALNRLRDQLNDPLFVRTRRGMEPTAFAMSLTGPIERSLADIRTTLTQSLHFDPAVAIRTFTLIMIDVGEITFLPPLLAELVDRAPSIRLRVLDTYRQSYEEYLDSGEADMVIGGVMLSDAFRSCPLFESHQVALLDRDHPLICVSPEGEALIDRESYLRARHVAIVPRGPSASRQDVTLGFEPEERHIALSLPHAGVLSTILPGTDLIATVPDVTARALSRDGRLRSVVLPFLPAPQHVRLWWHRRHDQDAGHVWMRSVIISARL
jgi:DNA-binding transcriptional LysR family regulator